jgi:hypothetical protein
MIDGPLPGMFDEVLLPPLKVPEMRPSPTTSLFDQSALSDIADRLVDEARRAGADAADVVAVRSVSLSVEVRDGAVEESERAEGDDLGLRVFIGRKQAIASTNDLSPAATAELMQRAVAMAKVAPEDKFAGLADEKLLAHDFPISICSTPICRPLHRWRRRRAPPNKPASPSATSANRAAHRRPPGLAGWSWRRARVFTAPISDRATAFR